MPMSLCIHGHFYQPPRQDPWLGDVLPEGSAAPGLNWNHRICRESYAPLAYARILDSQGSIRSIINAYEWINFNFGATLLCWMQTHAPKTYGRILDGDARSRKRLGFGNAMAQVRHHLIMPLATEQEKRVEVHWGIQDFISRFGRRPDGMWLAEAAVDTPTLEVLAEAGIAYTVLAPRQGAAVENPDGSWRDVDEGSLETRHPYRVDLPSGRSISVFFYHAALSQAVAFEGLLKDGSAFWNRIHGQLREGLLSLATDGETYGHHFTFGEMALAYVLEQASNDPELTLTNYASYLAAFPPEQKVRIHENSSWSCVHGIERWRGDCGCNTEGRQGWNQAWRGPLRHALRGLKDDLDEHFVTIGKTVFPNPWEALEQYGTVLAGEPRETFEAKAFASDLSLKQHNTARALLEMQRYAQASFASCAWFFDDLDRIEPMNAMANALRAMELAAKTGITGGITGIEDLFIHDMSSAQSNPTTEHPAGLGGDELFLGQVLPRRETPASLIIQALLTLWARTPGDFPLEPTEILWPNVHVGLHFEPFAKENTVVGTATLSDAAHPGGKTVEFEFTFDPGGNPLESSVRCSGGGSWFNARDLAWSKRQALALTWARAVAAKAWKQDLVYLETGRHLILDFTVYQHDQNLATIWGPACPALAWMWITGKAHGWAIKTFLLNHAKAYGTKARIQEYVTARALQLIDGETPDWEALAEVVTKGKEICPDLEWWDVQNRVWELEPKAGPGQNAAKLLGFCCDVCL